MAERLSIQILSPYPGTIASLKDIILRVQVTLDCGLPACSGGRFDPGRFRVTATFFHNDENVMEIPLKYTGNVGEFVYGTHLMANGSYVVEVNAYDPETGLAGRKTLNFYYKRPF
ncbi:MAG: hypothetical protein M0022_07370 [Desulfobacteraceae bacterium]|nr:hypothetical protein [Desulfobacteraceae bacterium]